MRRVLLLGGASGVAALVLWKVPEWQTAPWRAFLTPKELLLLQNDLRQTLVLVLGVAAVLAAIGLLRRRLAAGERAAEAAAGASRDAHASERFTQAVAQLADERLEVRLGAIYGLERVAQESAPHHWPAVEVLCAFVRNRAAWDPDRQQASLPGDVQAVLTVLGRRNRAHEDRSVNRLDLRRTDLRGADLKEVHLDGAVLFEAHLEGASLQSASLAGADLCRARLSGADLVEANLKGADLREAHLEAAYLVEARLEGADLGGAYLGGAYLGGAHLEGADLGGAHLDGAYLYKAHLEGASMHGARVMSAIGIHRDERERINRTAAAAEEEAALRPVLRPRRKAAAPESDAAAAAEPPARRRERA